MYTEVLSERNISYINTFNCEDIGINNYLKEKALIDQDKNVNTTTLVFNTSNKYKKLIGFYTLKNTSLLFKPDKKLRGLPAIEIVYIAVDKQYQRKRYGSQILQNIIYKSIDYSDSFSATQVLILSSLETCVKFYKKNSFKDFSSILSMLHDECRDSTVPLFLSLVV